MTPALKPAALFSKHRLEALSDGLFAIAMTLLILEIKVPVNVPHGELAGAIAKDAHGWISFVVTFGITSVFWTFQHRVFDLVEGVSTAILIATFVFLGFVSALPFSTAIWGHYIREPVAFLIYFGNQFFIAAALTAKLEIARSQGLLRNGPAAEVMRLRLYLMSLIMLSGGLATYFLPLQWVGVVPLPFAIVGRLVRNARERRLFKQANGVIQRPGKKV